MSAEERLDITKQLEDAISLNNTYPQKTEWSSRNYYEINYIENI